MAEEGVKDMVGFKPEGGFGDLACNTNVHGRSLLRANALCADLKK